MDLDAIDQPELKVCSELSLSKRLQSHVFADSELNTHQPKTDLVPKNAIRAE
jgi:hypothetical protein